MVAPTAGGGKSQGKTDKTDGPEKLRESVPEKRLVREPAVENGKVFRRDAFVETNAHAEPRADVYDTSEQVEIFALVGKLHAHDGAGGSWIERIDVAAGAANIAGARGKTRSRLHFNDFNGEDQRQAFRITSI